MAYDAHKNLAYSTIATAPSPATSGTTAAVQSGDGTKFPTAPFNALVWPAGVQPTTTNAEIVRVTSMSTDSITAMTRTQEGTSARTIVVGDQIAATITVRTITDLETLKADLVSPVFTGSPTAPDPSTAQGLATKAYVDALPTLATSDAAKLTINTVGSVTTLGVAQIAPLASPTFTGTVTLPVGQVLLGTLANPIKMWDGTGADGSLTFAFLNIGVGAQLMEFMGTDGDANAVLGFEANAGGTSAIKMGPGGASPTDVILSRTAAANASFTGTLRFLTGIRTDAVNIQTDTTTGTRIGTATGQKLGFFNASPVAQQGATIELGVALSTLGLRAAGTAYPITTTGAVSVGTLVSQLAGINTQTGTTYTMVAGDQSKMISMNNAAGMTLTIPANSSVAFPVGTQIFFYNKGAGTMTLAITTDALLGTTSYAANKGGVLTKLTANIWAVLASA